MDALMNVSTEDISKLYLILQCIRETISIYKGIKSPS